MNRKKALINITVSIIFKLIILVLTLLMRRYLVQFLGNEAVGLFSLYTSVIGFLSIAELGIGSAIMFSMYKPIVDGDNDTVSGLYFLYRKIYRIILIIIAIVGASLTPLIPIFAKDNTDTFNIYIAYLIYLAATIIPYSYAHKTSFINANLDNYVTIIIKSIAVIFEMTAQILVLFFIKGLTKSQSFNLFMFIMVISAILQMISTNIIFKIKYQNKITSVREVEPALKKDVFQKTKAMFFHKVGGLIVNSTDNIIISGVLSVSLLGYYTNYITLVVGLSGLLSLVFTSITSIIGHSYAKNTSEEFKSQFNTVYTINYILGFVFFLGFYAIIDNAILIIFGNNSNLILAKSIVVIITINHFIQFMRQSSLVFKDASGLFYKDRYKPILEGALNLVLSLILVRFWGISGVLISTIITNIFITNIIEPFVLYKYGFKTSPKKYYLTNYFGILVFVSAIILFNYISYNNENIYIETIINGLISIGISLIYLVVIYSFNQNFRKNVNKLIKQGRI